jgi:holo-[acyl-carrier protein] synthase
VIIGIGTDLIEVARVERVCTNNKRFLETMFTEAEREYSAKNIKNPYMHLAAAWAAKEALFKATNIRFRFGDAAVAHEKTGKPYFVFSQSVMDKFGAMHLHLTISHVKEYAIATVVADGLR